MTIAFAAGPMSDQESFLRQDPMVGQRIGRYVLRRQLAEGGMGAVYLATHEQLENIQKVVKLLLPGYAQNPVLRARFEREALAVSRLRHEHIVTIDDYGQLPDGQLFLMMPFLEGHPLDVSLAQARTFTEHRALHIAVQICSALQYMHDRGVVHRDIKPSNIFIVPTHDNPCHVTLIDLGIAKSLTDRDGVTHPGTTMGTPAYMAVEQYENAGDVTPLADLYAVAIVIWEMVAGSLPWGMHSAAVLYTKQKTERPVRPPGMSEAWWRILSRALSVHPEDRPQSMRELATALASTVPSIPPHVSSGAEILARLASSYMQDAPLSAEVIRKASHVGRMRPIVLAGVSCLLAGVVVLALADREAHGGPRPVQRVTGAMDALPPAGSAPWNGESPAVVVREVTVAPVAPKSPPVSTPKPTSSARPKPLAPPRQPGPVVQPASASRSVSIDPARGVYPPSDDDKFDPDSPSPTGN